MVRAKMMVRARREEFETATLAGSDIIKNLPSGDEDENFTTPVTKYLTVRLPRAASDKGT
jgi:hypothetical protein